MDKRWLIKSADDTLSKKISDSLNIPALIAQLLINRGLLTEAAIKLFMTGDMPHLYNPFLLTDMDKAVARLEKAKLKKQKILIFGDYDVDGVTSSALLRRLFKRMGIDAINYIPHRMEEGYGLNESIVKYALKEKVSILLAVDCGINAFAAIDALQKAGIDVIVLDHHEPDAGHLPNAHAVIDPKREDCLYPFKHLCAAGLAGKLIQAVLGTIPPEELDLIALGTVADVVPLHGENRIFVKLGLPILQRTKKPGLRALLDITKISGKPMKPYFIGFVLGPRLNAAGRMDSATMALDLLLTNDPEEAMILAQGLEKHNLERQKMQQEVITEAMTMIEDQGLHQEQIIVVHKEGWHKGVLGIAASRILEKYYRPTFVISVREGVGSGSARSMEGFHLHEALTKCSNSLEAYGGHKRAAGVTIKEDNIATFRRSINEWAQQVLAEEPLGPTLDIDAQLPLSLIDLPLTKLIATMQPHGEGNAPVILCTRQLKIKTSAQVLAKDTLKFSVTDGVRTYNAVGFGMGGRQKELNQGTIIDLAYSLEIDDWNKLPTVQLIIKDIKIV